MMMIKITLIVGEKSGQYDPLLFKRTDIGSGSPPIELMYQIWLKKRFPLSNGIEIFIVGVE